MSAVWRAARAAVRRRKLQTAVIGFVVFIATATTVLALALLAASSAPFDHAFAQQQGAHLVAAFDPERAADAQLAATAHLPGVAAAAGPFGTAVVEVSDADDVPGLAGTRRLTVVGRADPAGDPVDRVELWQGRWATGPGEIVLHLSPPPPGHALHLPEEKITVADGRAFTVVGFAHSLGRTAGAWVSPDQLASLRPTSTQMLYRFTDSGTPAEIEAGLREVTGALPADALQGSQSYLVLKQQFTGEAGAYVSFLLVFGVLGLGVSVLIVANVVSGAVVSGFRHIGVLKALGFTPRQVAAVYLVMVSIPAMVGCVAGTTVGHTGAGLLLTDMFRRLDLGDPGVSPWVDLAGLLGMPGVVALAALVPALRAHRLPAAVAISAGSAPRTGRGLRAQRWLSGIRLPRPVSLGLGLPCARPGRTALTLAAVLLGVVTVTFATGLASSVSRYAEVTDDHDTVGVRAHPPGSRSAAVSPERRSGRGPAAVAARHGPRDDQPGGSALAARRHPRGDRELPARGLAGVGLPGPGGRGPVVGAGRGGGRPVTAHARTRPRGRRPVDAGTRRPADGGDRRRGDHGGRSGTRRFPHRLGHARAAGVGV